MIYMLCISDYRKGTVLAIIANILQFAGPLFLKQILLYLEEDSD